jgi:hypothetical protein
LRGRESGGEVWDFTIVAVRPARQSLLRKSRDIFIKGLVEPVMKTQRLGLAIVYGAVLLGGTLAI